MDLCEDWNFVSTPVKLESTGNKNKFGQIVPTAAVVTAYRLYNNNWYPVTAYYVLNPLEALAVKIIAGGTTAVFVPEDGLSAPPTRNVYTGWSLVGPAPAYNGGFPDSPVLDVLLTGNMYTGGWLDGEFKFCNVVSAPFCQDGWTFNPWTYDVEPVMKPFEGYFVYVTAYGTIVGYSNTPLAGYSYTPL